MNPGAQVQIRIRAVRGLRAGLTSPIVNTRFLDGLITILYRRPSSSSSSSSAAVNAGEEEKGEEGAGEKVDALPIGSSLTVAELRQQLQVPSDRRLMIYLPEKETSSSNSNTGVSTNSSHNDAITPSIQGLALDHEFSTHQRLSDLIPLQPWYASGNLDQRLLYLSPPWRTSSSTSIVLYLANTAAAKLALTGNHASHLVNQQLPSLPFPLTLEMTPDTTAKDLKVSSFSRQLLMQSTLFIRLNRVETRQLN